MITFEQLSLEVYEDLHGRIAAVVMEGDAYSVVFECLDRNDHEQLRRFQLTFQGVAESTARPSASESLSVADGHPLLWNHNEEHVAMYLASASTDPTSLIGELYESHQRMLGRWRPFADYMHADSELLRGGYGLLAEGPKRIITQYARVIGDRLRYSILPGYTPAGGYRVVLFDECYVICRDVAVAEIARSA